MPGISELWLIGSRANGSPRPDSDWDFLAFANPTVLAVLQAETTLHRHDVDFLVVVDGDNFQSAWGEFKSGSLTRWHWVKLGRALATYQGEKLESTPVDPYEDSPYDMSSLSTPTTSTCNAYRVLPDRI